VRLVVSVFVLSAVIIPPLIAYSLDEESAECRRRREALMNAVQRLPNEEWWRARSCPSGNERFQFTVAADSIVTVVCPNGHGEKLLPLHTWFSAF
jgi:hypothetical protein